MSTYFPQGSASFARYDSSSSNSGISETSAAPKVVIETSANEGWVEVTLEELQTITSEVGIVTLDAKFSSK